MARQHITEVNRNAFIKEVHLKGVKVPRIVTEPWLKTRRYYQGDLLIAAVILYLDKTSRYFIWT